MHGRRPTPEQLLAQIKRAAADIPAWMYEGGRKPALVPASPLKSAVKAPLTRVVHVRRDPYDVYVGRPNRLIPKSAWGPFGNPFDVRTHGLARALELYAAWIREPAQGGLRERMRGELRGKILGCWCAPPGGLATNDPLACHAQIIAAIAATDPAEEGVT